MKGQVAGLIWVTNGDIMSQRETQQPDVGGELSVDPFLIPASSFTVTGTPERDCISAPLVSPQPSNGRVG